MSDHETIKAQMRQQEIAEGITRSPASTKCAVDNLIDSENTRINEIIKNLDGDIIRLLNE